MSKVLTVSGYGASGKVKKVNGGYNVVITVPFIEEATAKGCLDKLSKLR